VGRVNLTKRVRTADGLRYLPAVIAGNRRVKPHYVVVDSGKPTQREEHHPEGAYYLDWREGDKRRRQSVGNDPQNAAIEQAKKDARLSALAHGLSVADGNGNGRLFTEAITTFLADVELTKNQDPCRLPQGARVFPAILREAAPGGYREARPAQICCLSAGRQTAVRSQRVQQIRVRDVVS
jgi:hypothetical protein